MTRSVLALFFALLVTVLSLTSSSYAAPPTCSDATAARLQACLDQVERDESALPGGPCSSSDWRCICTKQQGMADCFAVCPSQVPADTANFDKNNCAGQHDGITMNDLGGDLMYTWSDLNAALGGTPDGNIGFPPNSTSSPTHPVVSGGPPGNKGPASNAAKNAIPPSASSGNVITNNANPATVNPAAVSTSNTNPANTSPASTFITNANPASNATLPTVPSGNSSVKQATVFSALPALSALAIVAITLPMLLI
ncbi:uncharacterized protein FA14DRAFT_173083 [Meira miltonrushii]|uniref:Extracellular membrane protein CFEM domain-containing protein n=1 Tax=Meira miltonrushii TaxID=1280837 RepID=A0A316VCI1_9BASI|nr:uncharacterized protein FA14DRAFT_173083 [Meira miltonrushii]PWN33265.1 hypothetical protein FA14DRAFT_173083 [Meira miltonrushii]